MDPSEYRERYLQNMTPTTPVRPRTPAQRSLLSLVDRYFPDHDSSEPYIDTLGRSELLRLVERCGVTPVNQRITGTQVLAGIQALRNTLDQNQTTIDRLYAELARSQAETEHLQAELAKRDENITKLSTDIVEVHSILSEVYRSTSWRITQPIRWLLIKLRR